MQSETLPPRVAFSGRLPRRRQTPNRNTIRQLVEAIQDDELSMKGAQYIYAVAGVGTNLVKVGVSADPEDRVNNMQLGSPVKLKLLGYCLGSVPIEQALHGVMEDQRSHREWFRNEGVCKDIVRAISSGDYEAVGGFLD